jgi:hypothetical protein
MNNNKFSWLIYLSILSMPAYGYAEDCSIWGTVLDESTVLSNNHNYISEQRHFCDVTQSVERYDEAKNQSIGAGIPIPFLDGILDFKFDGKNASDSSSFKDWRRHYCASNSYQNQSDSDIAIVTHTFSDNARKAAEACNNRAGLRGKITVSRDHTNVIINASYKPYDNEKEILAYAKIVPANAVSGCDPNNLLKRNNNKEIKNVNVSCKWDSTKAFSVELNTKTQHSAWPELYLDSDPQPVPPKPPSLVCEIPLKIYNPSAVNRNSLQVNCPSGYHIIDHTGDCNTTSPGQSGYATPLHGEPIGQMGWKCTWPVFSPEGVGLTVMAQCGINGHHTECPEIP